MDKVANGEGVFDDIFSSNYDCNTLLPVELVKEYLSQKRFDDKSIAVLVDKSSSSLSNEVVPSLCIVKPAGDISYVIRNISELYARLLLFSYNDIRTASLGSDKNFVPLRRDLGYVVDQANQVGFKVVYAEYDHVTILSKHAMEKHVLNDLSKVVCQVRRQSMHLLNDSMRTSSTQLYKISRGFDVNIEKTVESFKAFVEKEYALIAEVYLRDFSDKKWGPKDSKKLGDFNYQQLVNDYSELIDFRRPIYGFFDSRYLAILPFSSRNFNYYLNYVLLVLSDKPIKSYVISNLCSFIDHFFDHFLEQQKTGLLSHIQQKMMDLTHFSPQTESSDPLSLNGALKELASLAIQTILDTTSSYSGTLRLYDPLLNGLDLVIERMSKGVKKNVDQKISKSIPLKDKTSVNVLTFLGKNRSSWLYVEDLEKRTRRLKERTGSDNIQYSEHRINAKSELCFPLYFKNTCIGTMNFESPVKTGYPNSEIKFLQSIKYSIENYIVILFDLNDKNWMAKRTKTDQNIHEISGIIRNANFPGEWREEIDKYITKMDVGYSKKMLGIGFISEFVDEYFENYKDELKYDGLSFYSKIVYDEIRAGCKLYLNDKTLFVSEYKANAIKIIIKNLLDNYKKHGNTERDVVVIIHKPNVKRLIIKMKSSTRFDVKNIKNLLYEPYREEKDGEIVVHYGMYLVGMLARQIGGFAYVYTLSESNTEVLVSIPLND